VPKLRLFHELGEKLIPEVDRSVYYTEIIERAERLGWDAAGVLEAHTNRVPGIQTRVRPASDLPLMIPEFRDNLPAWSLHDAISGNAKPRCEAESNAVESIPAFEQKRNIDRHADYSGVADLLLS
jgi:hypothetical protein